MYSTMCDMCGACSNTKIDMGTLSTSKTVQHLISANRRRKRAEKTLKRVRKESTASINHWRKATSDWQRQAHEYATRYDSLLDTTAKKMEMINKILTREQRIMLLVNAFHKGDTCFIVRHGVEIECGIKSINISSGTCLDGSFDCDIELTNLKDGITNYAVEDINEIIIK